MQLGNVGNAGIENNLSHLKNNFSPGPSTEEMHKQSSFCSIKQLN